MEKIARYLDHAVLKPDMTPEEVVAAIQLGIDYQVKTVCVRGCDIDLALHMTKGTQTQVSCVLDFPYGYGGWEAKGAMAEIYAKKGVADIDMVMNYGAAKGGAWDVVEKEIKAVVAPAHKYGAIVKVIFETSQLTLDQIKKGTEVAIAAGADYVKTSTGFNGQGATPEAVQVMLDTAKGRCKVKPSGGIRDFATAKMYIEMGASRLGTGFTSCKPICDGEGQGEGNY